MTWFIGTLSSDEKSVLLASLIHTLHDMDASLDDDSSWILAEAMLDDLDATLNGAEPTGFVRKVAEPARPVLWASLWAAIRDVHAPQDQLTEAQWGIAEQIFALLDGAAAR